MHVQSHCFTYALHSSTDTKVGPSEGLDMLKFILWKDAHNYTAAMPILQTSIFYISACRCHLYLNAAHSPDRYHFTALSVFQENLSLIHTTGKMPFLSPLKHALHRVSTFCPIYQHPS